MYALILCQACQNDDLPRVFSFLHAGSAQMTMKLLGGGGNRGSTPPSPTPLVPLVPFPELSPPLVPPALILLTWQCCYVMQSYLIMLMTDVKCHVTDVECHF